MPVTSQQLSSEIKKYKILSILDLYLQYSRDYYDGISLFYWQFIEIFSSAISTYKSALL